MTKANKDLQIDGSIQREVRNKKIKESAAAFAKSFGEFWEAEHESPLHYKRFCELEVVVTLRPNVPSAIQTLNNLKFWSLALSRKASSVLLARSDWMMPFLETNLLEDAKRIRAEAQELICRILNLIPVCQEERLSNSEELTFEHFNEIPEIYRKLCSRLAQLRQERDQHKPGGSPPGMTKYHEMSDHVHGGQELIFPAPLVKLASRVAESDSVVAIDERAELLCHFYNEACALIGTISIMDGDAMEHFTGDYPEMPLKDCWEKLKRFSDAVAGVFHKVNIGSDGGVFVDGELVDGAAEKMLLFLAYFRQNGSRHAIPMTEENAKLYFRDKRSASRNWNETFARLKRKLPRLSLRQTGSPIRWVDGILFLRVDVSKEQIKKQLKNINAADQRNFPSGRG